MNNNYEHPKWILDLAMFCSNSNKQINYPHMLMVMSLSLPDRRFDDQERIVYEYAKFVVELVESKYNESKEPNGN